MKRHFGIWCITLVGAITIAAGSLSAGAADVAASEGPLPTVHTVVAGFDGSCAVLTSGTVKCWGGGSYGQLGNGTTSGSDVAVTVKGISTATTVTSAIGSGGSDGSYCALLAAGTVKCWGYNAYGELGNGTTTNFTIPVSVKGIANATAVSRGFYGYCALLSTSAVKCWGYNADGELGNGSTTGSTTPVAVKGITGARTVVGGDGSSCALLATGKLKCWGYNGQGELGNGTTTGSDVPVAVSGVSGVGAIVASHGFSNDGYYCAVLATAKVSCWGYNAQGELGNGTTANSDLPVGVLGLSGATAVSGGYLGTCALLSTSNVKCWGYNNDGELGNGSTTGSTIPVTVKGITGASTVVGGDGSSCALLSTGKLKCWGYNGQGELGNGTTSGSDVPVAVTGVTSANALVVGNGNAGDGNYCVVLASARASCWGYNGDGELGNGTTTTSDVPVTVIT